MKEDILGNEYEEDYYWSATGNSETIFGAWRNPDTGEIYMVSAQQEWTGNGIVVYNSESGKTECTAGWECSNDEYEHLARTALKKKRLKLDDMERITFQMHDQTDESVQGSYDWGEGMPEMSNYLHYRGSATDNNGSGYFYYPCEWPLGRAVKARMHSITVLDEKGGDVTTMDDIDPVIVEVI